LTFNGLYGVIFQKIELFLFILSALAFDTLVGVLTEISLLLEGKY
jgi:hypothetical protein